MRFSNLGMYVSVCMLYNVPAFFRLEYCIKEKTAFFFSSFLDHKLTARL